MSASPSLLTIIGYARGGATEHAWNLLKDGGYDTVRDDPAVLCVVGRLLKDKAIAARGEARQQFFYKAVEAYIRAGDLNGAAYPLINAATLSFLAGNTKEASSLATRALAASSKDEAETAYYRLATQAEAHLLLGNLDQAKRDLFGAIRCAPFAYEDHATTVRQFARILRKMGEEAGWLDACRPPSCLHFAGHMGAPAHPGLVEAQIREVLHENRVGFGFGALAAGADILIAEALIEDNAELHVILPVRPELFREISVCPYGPEWAPRFDLLMEQATSLTVIDESLAPSHLLLQIASEVAMGRALMQAHILATNTLQLAILDGSEMVMGEAGSTRWAHHRWQELGRAKKVLRVPRSGAFADDTGFVENNKAEFLAATLRISWPNVEHDPNMPNIVSSLGRCLASCKGTLVPPRWIGDAIVVAFASPLFAANAAFEAFTNVPDFPGLKVAADYGIVERYEDPLGTGPMMRGNSAALPGRLITITPPGAFYVTEAFAAAMHAGGAGVVPTSGYIGDLPQSGDSTPVRLYALQARYSD